MEKLLQQITDKKQKLDQLSPLPREVGRQLEEWLRVELTYSSNAIEGNTLTRIETAEVIEKGIHAVISGKPLKDLLEAWNHAQAVDFVKEIANKHKGHQFITEQDILDIHKIVLADINDDWAGRYRQTEVFIAGSTFEFPLPHSVPYAMQEFFEWLQQTQESHPVKIAADAHYKLVTIHPFVDGNGRTARLLMNLILLMNGYPLAVIRNEDRQKYLDTFAPARSQEDMRPFYKVVAQAVGRSLDAFIATAQGKPALPKLVKRPAAKKMRLLKIGELAKSTDETVHTLRYWTKQGLLIVSDHSQGGYQLYSPTMIERAREIRRLQTAKRMTLSEIKKELKAA